MSHRLRRIAPVPVWPSFAGSAHYVGTSAVGQVSVYVDPSLGTPAMQNATDLLADADRVVNANVAIFGTPSQPVNVIVFALDGRTDGTGGADHNACDFTDGGNIEVCASFGNAARVSALFEAELSECAMGGNLCGVSTGEALSRWCAAVVGNNALADFASAPAWAQAGMPDYVTRTDNTDQNEISTGCGMAFLSWLQKPGYPLKRIAPAMVSLGTSGVLAQLYSRLTGGRSESRLARIPRGRQSSATRSFRRSVRGACDPAAPRGADPHPLGKESIEPQAAGAVPRSEIAQCEWRPALQPLNLSAALSLRGPSAVSLASILAILAPAAWRLHADEVTCSF